MGYKSETVDDNLVEDYMTTPTMTMNFKNNVLDIAKKMYTQSISSIPITDDEGEIVGILTERDIVKVIANELQPRAVSAMNLMSFPAVKIKKNVSVVEAAKIMAAKNVRHLIVEDIYGTRTVGIITTTDLARYLKQKSKTEGSLVSEVWELYF